MRTGANRVGKPGMDAAEEGEDAALKSAAPHLNLPFDHSALTDPIFRGSGEPNAAPVRFLRVN